MRKSTINVIGTKDEVDSKGNPVYQCIDQSKIVPLLVAAVQELIAKVEILEAGWIFNELLVYYSNTISI